MIRVLQIKLSRMDTFSYLIGDGETGCAALVDPAFDTDRLLAVARDEKLTVTHVINTHAHPDHTAGNAAVLAATGAALVMHELAAQKVSGIFNRGFSRILGGKGSPRPDITVAHGDRISIGSLQLDVLHTPGHTPDSICLYSQGHLFTGDTLFVRSVGRTDLPGGSAAQLIKAIDRHLYSLPGDTVVWPGHDYGPSPSSTIAAEIAENPFTKKF